MQSCAKFVSQSHGHANSNEATQKNKNEKKKKKLLAEESRHHLALGKSRRELEWTND